MQKKIWVHKSDSYKKVDDFENEYYRSMSPSERLETIQYLRELAWRLLQGSQRGQRREGLRRVIKVIQ